MKLKLSLYASMLLRGLQQQDQRLLDLITNKKGAVDELINLGLLVDDGTRIVDYSYVTSISLTEEGKRHKL